MVTIALAWRVTFSKSLNAPVEILSKITLPGAILLTLLAVLPAIVKLLGVEQSLAMFFGGTSMLIMVGVILDTVQQINTYLLNHRYDGLMSSGRTSRDI